MCLEYDPEAQNESGEYGMFKVINRLSVPRSEFTLDTAVNRIVRWNKVYQPDFIYCDRGFGEYQIERLHILGKEAQKGEDAYGLNKKVVGVSFSENREVKDPGSGELIKKPVKPWMVNQSVILFERDRMIISDKDDMLWKQLENYRVEKISVDGRPTYTSINEHAVDALLLCVLAITDKFPELTKLVKRFEPTRAMALAPSPAPNMPNNKRDLEEKQKEVEYFFSKDVKAANSQTWFKVDESADQRRRSQKVQDILNNPLRPRGYASGRGSRPTTRKKF